jgi:hypothetical protein
LHTSILQRKGYERKIIFKISFPHHTTAILRCGADHPTPFIGEVNESVELYLHSPSGLSWPVLG